MAYAWRILDSPKCATDVTPLVTKYAWRILRCAMHSLPISGASYRCVIDKLCVAHITICATDVDAPLAEKKCATNISKRSKKLLFSGINWYLYRYIQVYSIIAEYTAIQNSISSSDQYIIITNN